jgi:hypothetical protein
MNPLCKNPAGIIVNRHPITRYEYVTAAWHSPSAARFPLCSTRCVGAKSGQAVGGSIHARLDETRCSEARQRINGRHPDDAWERIVGSR